MSAPAFDPALAELMDAGNIASTSCDGTARAMLTAAALEYARSLGWRAPLAREAERTKGFYARACARQTERVKVLEATLRAIITAADDDPNVCSLATAINCARGVLT